MTVMSEIDLWKTYRQQNCARAKSELFKKYSDWAEFEGKLWSRKLNLEGVSQEDFISLAYEGVLESMLNFDPEKGFKFESFAKQRIKGNILNRIFKFSEQSHFLQKTGVFIPEVLEFDEEEFEDSVITLATQYFLSRDVTPAIFEGTQYSSPEFNALVETCKKRIEILEEPLDEILKLHYEFHVSLSDIATLLSITKGRVSQLHKKAIMRLSESI